VTIGTGICQLFGNQVEGSGIPEMKTVLSGADSINYLQFKFLIGKIIALPAVIAGSL
jgi:H+/Cl- antiporter ClcA